MRFFPPFIISLTVNSEFSQKKNFFFLHSGKTDLLSFYWGSIFSYKDVMVEKSEKSKQRRIKKAASQLSSCLRPQSLFTSILFISSEIILLQSDDRNVSAAELCPFLAENRQIRGCDDLFLRLNVSPGSMLLTLSWAWIHFTTGRTLRRIQTSSADRQAETSVTSATFLPAGLEDF